MWEYQKVTPFFLSVIIEIDQKLFLSYVTEDVNGENNVGKFYQKELQKTNHIEIRVDEVTKKKGDHLYVEWKGYNISFNNWIDKEDFII